MTRDAEFKDGKHIEYSSKVLFSSFRVQHGHSLEAQMNESLWYCLVRFLATVKNSERRPDQYIVLKGMAWMNSEVNFERKWGWAEWTSALIFQVDKVDVY